MAQGIQEVFFGDGVHHDLSNPNEVLGCKGANLAVTRLGLPVPPGLRSVRLRAGNTIIRGSLSRRT